MKKPKSHPAIPIPDSDGWACVKKDGIIRYTKEPELLLTLYLGPEQSLDLVKFREAAVTSIDRRLRFLSRQRRVLAALKEKLEYDNSKTPRAG